MKVMIRREFVGRDADLTTLDRAWRAARGGTGQVVDVDGESGIGKTELIRHFLARVPADRQVRVHGFEDDPRRPWALLRRITGALTRARTPIAALDPQEPADPLLVGEGLTALLAEFDQLVLVVDNAHWADHQSLTALMVAARSVADRPVLLVVVHDRWRPYPEGSSPMTEVGARWSRVLELDHTIRVRPAPLTVDDLLRLAVAAGRTGVTPEFAGRLREFTGGLPRSVWLVFEEAKAMNTLVYGHRAPVVRPGHELIALRWSQCPAEVRQFTAAAAVIGTGFRLSEVHPLLDLPDLPAAAAAAVEHRLVTERGDEYEFADWTTHNVIYHGIEPSERLRLHRRAATGTGPAALRHRVIAGGGQPDEQLALDLQNAARARQARGEPTSAARYLRQALEVAPAGSRTRARLVLSAVEALLVVGDHLAAGQYETELAALTPSPWSDYVGGYLRLVHGRDPDGAEAMLRQALAGLSRAGAARPEGLADLESRIAAQLAIIAVIRVDYPGMVEYGTRAVATAQEPWVAAFAGFARCIGLALVGRAAEALLELGAAHRPESAHGLDGLAARGMIRLWTDDLAGARADLARVVEQATTGRPLRIAQAVGFLGEVDYRMGALDDAVMHTQLAVGNATEHERMWDLAILNALATYPLAARGEWERAEHHAGLAAMAATIMGNRAGLAYAAGAAAAIAQARGDAAGLLAAAEDIAAVYDSAEPGTHLFGPLVADALAQLGRADAAAAALDEFEARVATGARTSTRAAAERVRGRIAAARDDHDRALRHYAVAAELTERVGLPLERARIAVLAAESLAATRRGAAAGREIHAAVEQFGALGAGAYLDAALRTAGRLGLTADAPVALSGRQREVLDLLRSGQSDHDIARRLDLSLKTVQTHVTKAVQKYGVRNRRELLRLLDSGSP